MAKRLRVKTIALLEKNGAQAKALSELEIVIPRYSNAWIQEAHILFGHIPCDLIERELGLV